MTQICRDIKVLISHPFCLPYGNAPLNRYSRRSKLEILCDSLGEGWEVFDVDGILPAVMKKRKDILLKHKEVENKYMFDFAVQLNKEYESSRKVVSVSHSAYMWDFGLCAVDVVITLRVSSTDGFVNVYPFAEAFEEEMLDKEMYKPPGCDTWQQVQSMFSKGFARAGMKTIHWLTNAEAPTYLMETCCWNLIMTLEEDKSKSIFASKDVLDKCLEEFCGQKTTDECFETGVLEFYASHTGYSGNVSIVINDDEALRVQWLYKVVAILYSALLDSSEPCYDLVTDLIANEGSSPTSIADIRLVQKVIDILHAEANPIAICSESFDAQIYENVWNCWGGDAVDQLVDKRTEFLMHTLADLSEQRSQNLQGRLNFVVFILTIVSIASTVAAVIDLLDTDNDSQAYSRALVLAIITGIIGLGCAIVVAVDVYGLFNQCRRGNMFGAAIIPSGRKGQGSAGSSFRKHQSHRRSSAGKADTLTVKVVDE